MTATTLAVLSIIVTAATGAFVWWQARLLRFSLQVQSFLAFEKTFNERDLRRRRVTSMTCWIFSIRWGCSSGRAHSIPKWSGAVSSTGCMLVQRASTRMSSRNAARTPAYGRTWRYDRLVAIENRQGVQHQENTADSWSQKSSSTGMILDHL